MYKMLEISLASDTEKAYKTELKTASESQNHHNLLNYSNNI
jgi:hypothetical protein